MFYGLQNIYSDGLLFIIPVLGAPLCLLFTGQVLAIRMGEFLNNLSVAEAMENLYHSRIIRVITATSGIFGCIGSMAIQFQVMSRIFTFLLGMESQVATISAATIVIFYSAFGGVRSVTITDVFQFIAFSIFIPTLGLIVFNHLKDPTQVVHTFATNPLFDFKTAIGWNMKSLSGLALMLFYTIPGLDPSIFQRISMAKDLTQVKNSSTYAAGIMLLMILSVAWIAILLLTNNPGLDPKQLINHIVENYAYTGLKGFVAVGIAAMAMSTADSELNASVVLAVNDIIRPLKKEFKESLRIVRLFSLLIGCFGMLLALYTTDLLELLLLTGDFWMPIVSVPLLLAVFGFRSSKRAVLIGMGAGFITVCLGKIFDPFAGLAPLIPGIIANLVCYMGSHYVLREQGGWVGIQVKAPLLAARQRRKEAWQKFIHTIKHPQIYANLQKTLPANDIIYTLLGIYILGATFASFYTIPGVESTYSMLYKYISHSIIFMVAMFITYPAWPPTFKSKKFITFAWPVGMCYTLFVVGTMLVMMSKFHEVQIMIFLLNLLIAALLLSLPVMLLLSTTGMVAGYWVLSTYCCYMGIPYESAAISSQFKVICGILLFSSFLIALFRLKQRQTQLEEKNKYLLDLCEEHNKELSEVLAYREEVLHELEEEEMKLIDKTAVAYLKQVLYRTVDYLRLDVAKITIEQLLADVKHLVKVKDFTSVPHILTNGEVQDKTIQVDAAKIKQLFVNSISYIHQHNFANKPIIITVSNTMLGHSIGQMEDYTRQLNAVRFTISTDEIVSPTQDLYMLDQINLISQTNQNSDRQQLIENAKIVDAHYGYAELSNHHTHMFVLPTNVREVRGKVMELLRDHVEEDPEEVKHPIAIQLEQKLLAKIQPLKNINIKEIEKALDTIKKYHAKVKRKSGEPFFTHPINVALILLQYCQDQDAVVAALLHDTVEDTSLSASQVQAKFGNTVAILVEKLTNLEDKAKKFSLDNHEYIARLTQSEDKRVAYVKLADRLHNMRTIQGHPLLRKQKKISDETFNRFVPMAEHLNLPDVAQELKDISLKVLGKKD